MRILVRRKAAFLVRTEQYLSLGFDRFAAADFVVKTGGRLSGPALDIGTGKGLTAMALARRGLEVVSVDPDADEQALAFLLAAEAGLEDRIRFVHGRRIRLALFPKVISAAPPWWTSSTICRIRCPCLKRRPGS